MESQGEEAMDQPTQAEPDHHSRPAVVIVFTALLLIVAAVCVYMVVRGSLRWPVPVLVAVTCVITAQGVWRLREWARRVAILLLGLGLFAVALGVSSYWEATIVPIAGLLAIICVCPPLVPLGLLLYWFVSNDECFQ